MAYDPKDLYSVLLFIKDQYGVEVLTSNKAVSILMDLAPELKRDSKVLQKLIDNKLIETLVNLDDQSRESEIKRIEMVLEDHELIHPMISDYCVRTVVDVFNGLAEEKTIETEKEEVHYAEDEKPYVIPYYEDNISIPTSKSKAQRIHQARKIFIIIGIVIFAFVVAMAVSESVIGNRMDNQATGLTEIVDPAKDYSRYLGQDIYTVASEINSTETVDTGSESGFAYYRSEIGAEENFSISLSTTNNGHTINDIYFSGNSKKSSDGSNILGITPGMSKSEAEKVLRDQGFEMDTTVGDLKVDKDDYSIIVAIKDHKVDYVSISNNSF